MHQVEPLGLNIFRKEEFIMAALEIKNNGWNVHISLDNLSNSEIGEIFRTISEEGFNWANFSIGDDLWFEGDLSLTCMFIQKEYKHMTFMKITTLEKFCLALENGDEFDFLHDEETYAQLTKQDMRSIIANMLTVIEAKDLSGNIIEEIIKDIRMYAVR